MNTRMDNSLSLAGSRPASVADRPGSSAAVRSNTYHPIAPTSNVDETLFASKPKSGAEFDAPWNEKKKTPKPLFWSPPASSSSEDSSARPQSSRKGMPSTRNKYRLVKHKDSYCDEMLFGGPLQEPKFPAPWEKKEKKVRPLVFTGVDYTIKQKQALSSARPPTGRSSRVDNRPGSGLDSNRSTKPNAQTKPFWR